MKQRLNRDLAGHGLCFRLWLTLLLIIGAFAPPAARATVIDQVVQSDNTVSFRMQICSGISLIDSSGYYDYDDYLNDVYERASNMLCWLSGSLAADGNTLCSFYDLGIDQWDIGYGAGDAGLEAMYNVYKSTIHKIQSGSASTTTYEGKNYTVTSTPEYSESEHTVYARIKIKFNLVQSNYSFKISAVGLFGSSDGYSFVIESVNSSEFEFTYKYSDSWNMSVKSLKRINDGVDWSVSWDKPSGYYNNKFHLRKNNVINLQAHYDYNHKDEIFTDTNLFNADDNTTSGPNVMTSGELADNRNSFIVYPIGSKTRTYDGLEIYKYFDAVTLPGYPYPTITTAEVSDYTKKTVLLKWEINKNDSNVSTDGKWCVYREQTDDSDTRTLIATLNADVNEYEDTETDASLKSYGHEYLYSVVFVPTGWTVEQNSDADKLYDTATIDLPHTFKFTGINVEDNKNGLHLTWGHTKVSWASVNNPITLTIERSTDEKSWTKVADVLIESNKTEGGEYYDTEGVSAFQPYAYRIGCLVEDDHLYSDTVYGTLDSGFEILSFNATHGQYTGTVKLSWEIEKIGSTEYHISLERRPLGSSIAWASVYSTAGTQTSYSYDDQTAAPGTYYEYRVSAWVEINGEVKGLTQTTTDGFCMATGIVSGRIYYDSGTAVPDVKVSLKPNVDEGEQSDMFRAIEFSASGTASGIYYDASAEDAEKLTSGDFSVQFYLNPKEPTASKGGFIELCVMNLFGFGDANLSLGTLISSGSASTGSLYTVKPNDVNESLGEISWDQWNHITMTYRRADKKLTLYVINQEGKLKSSSSCTVELSKLSEAQQLRFCKLSSADGNAFNGKVDEFRYFTKALTEAEILKNFNHTLSGLEDGLAIYWPMDEGIENTKVVYDYSKTSNVMNDRVGRMETAATSSKDYPGDELLSLCSYTDANGNYTVRGIHFSGEGTNYSVTPSLGVHSFNPSSQTRFVSINSLVHSGVDFTDESSFPVSGQVFYEGTTIPVADVAIKVDGTLAVKDGEAVKTAEDGTFTVSVPIGDHFVSLDLSSHTFADGGRYPADPNNLGLRHTFESAVSGLTFYDQTKVVIAGRVAGGADEENKSLGFGVGVANIGQATITLDFENNDTHFINAAVTTNGTSVSYDKSSEQLDYESTLGHAFVKANDNAITIVTDANTGEFAASVPPLKYTARSVIIPTQTDIDFTKKLPTIDASNAATTYTDSIQTDNGVTKYFKYHASAKVIHNAVPELSVVQAKSGSAFGEKTVSVADISGNSQDVEVYDSTESPTYAFGYPVFTQLNTYNLELSGYERYVNKDGGEGNYIITDLPIKEAEITVKNELGTGIVASVETGEIGEMTDDTFKLDSLGRATYSFKAGLPNIQAPYTRSLNISYKYNNIDYSWSENGKFKGIILGALPKGNNFVTNGPDQVLTIIRDPGGSYSKTTFTKGTSVVSNFEWNVSAGTTFTSASVTKVGFKTIVSMGLGAAVINSIEVSNETTLGTEISAEAMTGNTTQTTLTATQDISTSSDTDYVGANGDVFVGVSTNIVIGGASIVKLTKNEMTGKYEVTKVDGTTVGNEYATTFNYTAAYIENELLPNFIKLRNSLLTQVPDVKAINNVNEITYVTTLSPDDSRFGSSNSDKDVWGDEAVSDFKIENGRFDGPSYSVIVPATISEGTQDMVNYYNEQHASWIKCLARNEEEKVKAISGGKYTNYSLDGGSDITVSYEKNEAETNSYEVKAAINAIYDNKIYAAANDLGCGYQFGFKVTGGTTIKKGSTDVTTTGYSFTLSDNPRDNISIDVYNASATNSPIFYTRAGLTSEPFEDEVVTKYYQPGFVISQKTQQIEKPEIEVLDAIVTGVPSGKNASIRVALRNNSEAGRDIYYGLCVVPESNPNGASIDCDGKNITEGIMLLVPYGTTLYKTLTFKQTNTEVLDYENIKLKMYSLNQRDDTNNFPGIYSTGTVSVHFQPTCSDISLSANTKVINSESTSPLMLNIRGYDYSMSSLKGVRLQYRGANDANFVTLQEYTKDEEAVKNDANLMLLPALTSNNSLSYSVDLAKSSFTDQTYVFRAITVCDSGSGEINNESEEIEVVRDMTRPQLISMPTPTSGVLYPNEEISITFAEDIRSGSIGTTENFTVVGDLNESTVVHDVALSVSGEAQARSQSTLDLTGNPFSVSMWINYTADGQIFQHGANDNGFSVNTQDGRLLVKVGGKEFLSDAALPKDKWIYLNVSYDNSGENRYVSAGYAVDDESVDLLKNKVAPAYSGNGPVSVGGEGLTAKISELSLWNSSRTLSEAQADMYTSKSLYTNGLIGYWRFNEGHGASATDIARSRHIILPGENAWWISGVNYSLAFDGQSAADLNVSALSTATSDSYMIEGWMRADKEQDGAATFWSAGNKLLEMRLNEAGGLELVTNGVVNQVSDTDMRDDQWHHIALNVLHSTNGSATVYVDGEAKRQFAASTVPSFQAEVMTLGAHRTSLAATELHTNTFLYERFFKGNIDEVRLWKGRLTADVISANRYNRLDAKTDGLLAYFPFETETLDQYNQAVSVGTLADFVGKSDGLTMAGGEDGTTTVQAVFDTANSPALKAAPAQENVAFSVVASERRVTLTLTEEPYRLEGCHIYITAKNIRDTAGNACDPIKWQVLVQQNVLKWSESEYEISRSIIGEKSVFNVDIENLASTSEHWQIENLPSWLTVNVSSGTLMPISTGTVKFTVDESLAVGNHEATVYLRSSLNITTPLHISVTVDGIVPDWTAFPDEYSMNVVAKLKIDGSISSDPKDLIAAFDGTKCVGVGSPQYYSRYDAYIVPLTIYGSSTDRRTLRYKIYDAGTGKTYPIVSADNDKAMTFVADTWVGTFNNPVTFTPEDKIEQNISQVRAGWQWVSLYVTPDVSEIAKVISNEDGAITLIKNDVSTALYESGVWGGSLTTLADNTMYKIHADDVYSYDLTGAPSDPAKVTQTLKHEWNWIGYPCSATNSLNEAFAGANPKDGDLVKSQTGFAMFTDSEWIGSLASMNPGDGYNYYSNDTSTKTFSFPAVVAQSSSVSRAKALDDRAASEFNSHCENTATMIAIVKDGDFTVDNAVISVIAGGDLRGYSDAAVVDDLHFVTIGCEGRSAETFTFDVKVGDDQYVIPAALVMSANQHIGTMSAPYVVQINDATRVNSLNVGRKIARVMLYSPTGAMIMEKSAPESPLTSADLTTLPTGVYIESIIYSDGTTVITKLLR